MCVKQSLFFQDELKELVEREHKRIDDDGK